MTNTVPDGFRDRIVCIMGLGYVGLTLATVMVEVGFEVWGIEIREDLVRLMKEGKAHFSEPGITERSAAPSATAGSRSSRRSPRTARRRCGSSPSVRRWGRAAAHAWT